MLRVIHGADTFTAHERLRDILSSCRGEVGEMGNVQWLDGRTASPVAILDACGQTTMFGGNTVVVVEGLLSRFSKEEPRRKPAKGKKPRSAARGMEEWGGFAERVRALLQSSVLIFLDGELKGENPLLASLVPASDEVIACPLLKQEEVAVWIRQRVAGAEGRINDDAATRLRYLVGPDLWQLSSEIEKLVLYSGGTPITLSMVDAMAASSPAPSIFQLVDAIVERSATLARRRLDDLYGRGLNAGFVFTMVGRQLRIIAQIHEARRHRGAALKAPDLERLQPFALERARRQAQLYSEERVNHALACLVAADRSVKTGLYNEQMALEMLVTDLLESPAA